MHYMAVSIFRGGDKLHYFDGFAYHHQPNGLWRKSVEAGLGGICDSDCKGDYSWSHISCIALYYDPNDLEKPRDQRSQDKVPINPTTLIESVKVLSTTSKLNINHERQVRPSLDWLEHPPSTLERISWDNNSIDQLDVHSQLY